MKEVNGHVAKVKKRIKIEIKLVFKGDNFGSKYS